MRGRSVVSVAVALATIVLGSIGAAAAQAEAPEFGRCLAAPGGAYKNSSCTMASNGKNGKFEWHPGVEKAGFSTKNHGKKIAFEGVNKVKVACTAESSTGEFTSPKLEEHVVFKFTGCEAEGEPAHSPGAASGEVVTNPTECELGVLIKGSTPREDKTGLTCAEEGTFMQINWKGNYGFAEAEWALRGWWFFTIAANKMKTTTSLFSQESGGNQYWEKFVEGPPEPLEATFNGGETWERAALSLHSVQTNEEPVEVNTVA